MGNPGLDPNTAFELVQVLLYLIAFVLAGFALVGLSAYILFLCVEIFFPQPSSKDRLVKVPHLVGCAPLAEENLDEFAVKTPILAGPERLGEDAVAATALPHDAQTRRPLVLVTLGSEPTGP